MKKFYILIVLCIVITGCSNKEDDLLLDEEYKPCVTFMNNGKEYKNVCVNKGETIEKPEDPQKEGYEFSHWATHTNTVDGSEVFDFSKPITQSEALFAHYKVIEKKEEKVINYTSRYEIIYNEYSERLKKECPYLSITECAQISTDGVSKMAEYMYNASGVEGQYNTYESWAQKLIDVYLQEAR